MSPSPSALPMPAAEKPLTRAYQAGIRVTHIHWPLWDDRLWEFLIPRLGRRGPA